jgi:uncharacterized protein
MNKPFIKLFRSPNDFYFYEVGKNEIIRVSEELFNYLEGILSDAPICIDKELCSQIDFLQDNGYLSDIRPQRIKHPYSANLKLLLDRKIESITLQLTQECNFRCSYCIYSGEKNTKQRSHSSECMSWETAKKAIDFFLEHSIDSESRSVGFYGGEPLLQFDLLKKVVEYSEEKLRGKHLEFNITTNGSLLSAEVAEFFDLHNFTVFISLDGPKEVHDKNRVFKNGQGTYDAVAQRMSEVKERVPSLFEKLRISMVLDPDVDIDCLNLLTLELEGLDATHFFPRFIDNTDEDIIYPEQHVIKTEYQKFLAYLFYFGKLPQEVLSPLGYGQYGYIRTVHTHFAAHSGMSTETAPGGLCVPGKNKLLVTVNERLFPCERLNENDIMCIGNLSDGLNYENADRLLNIASLTQDECKDCWAQRLCDVCAKAADAGNKFSKEKKLLRCFQTQGQATARIQTMILIYEFNHVYNIPGRTAEILSAKPTIDNKCPHTTSIEVCK